MVPYAVGCGISLSHSSKIKPQAFENLHVAVMDGWMDGWNSHSASARHSPARLEKEVKTSEEAVDRPSVGCLLEMRYMINLPSRKLYVGWHIISILGVLI